MHLNGKAKCGSTLGCLKVNITVPLESVSCFSPIHRIELVHTAMYSV